MDITTARKRERMVNREDLESLANDLRRQVSRPSDGIFGPESLSWRIHRESALFLAAGRAALLQLAHPWVAAAINQHSSVISKPIQRFHNTFRVVFTMIFGSADQAIRAAQSLHELHSRIRGSLPEAVAGYAAQSVYQANEIGALRWVFATLIESAVVAFESVVATLSEEEREAYYAETRMLANLFGIPGDALPQDWRSFKDYVAGMVESKELGVNDWARVMGQRILAGAGSWIRVPRWYRALTAQWLAPRFVAEFGLPFGEPEAESARRAQRLLPRVYRNLPSALRFVGPYHEACARLAQRPSGFLVQRSNRFWIGEAMLPFRENNSLRQ